EWTRGTQCRGRVGRGVFLWATFLCTSKERWLAPRRGAKAFDPAFFPLLWLPLDVCDKAIGKGSKPSQSQSQSQPKPKAEAKHESRAFAPASQERVTSLCSCKEK